MNTRSALGADVAVHLSLIKSLDPLHIEVYVATNSNCRDHDKILFELKSLPEGRLSVHDLGHEVSSAGSSLPGKMLGLAKNAPALLSLCKLSLWIRKNGIKLIHSTDRPRDAVFAALLGKMSGCKHVVHAHISWHPYMGARLNAILNSCAGLITISEFTRKSFADAGVSPSSIHMAHNATDPQLFDPDTIEAGSFRRKFGIDSETPLIGIVARIMVFKGHLELIEALALIRDSIPDVKLAIVGVEDTMGAEAGMSFSDRLREQITAHRLEENVIWTGWIDAMPEVMRDLDALAMPSYDEPFGLAVTEAMAMQTPVVGFAAGALPEIITDGVEGSLVPPRSSEALAKALINILQNRSYAREMGIKGRERILKQFTPEAQAQKVESIYASILS